MNKTALIPGSFDPITRGHVDVIERTAKIFDEVIVAVFDNSEKRTLFTAEQRLEMTRLAVQRFPNVRADLSNGLLAEYAKKHNAVLVKGVRNVTDFDYEYWLAAINRNMDEKIETIFIPASAEVQHISSTVVREMLKYGRSCANLVTPEVDEYMKKIRG